MKYFLFIIILITSLNSYAIILGANELQKVDDSKTPEVVQRLAKTVGHVHTSMIFPSKCSGVLVSNSLFLTTTDCVPSYLTAGRIKIYFNNLKKQNSDKYSVSEIVMRNGAAKIVLLRLKKNPGQKQGYLKFSDYTNEGDGLGYIETDKDSNILQYMNGPCEVYGYSEDNFLAHTCDTTVQGAPLLNERQELVGIQYGFYFTSPALNNAIPSYVIEPLVRPYLSE